MLNSNIFCVVFYQNQANQAISFLKDKSEHIYLTNEYILYIKVVKSS